MDIGMAFGLGVLAGVWLSYYLTDYANKSVVKEAEREAKYMNLAAINYELERLEEEWLECGTINKNKLALMEAIKWKRSDLMRRGVVD